MRHGWVRAVRQGRRHIAVGIEFRQYQLPWGGTLFDPRDHRAEIVRLIRTVATEYVAHSWFEIEARIASSGPGKLHDGLPVTQMVSW